MTTPALVVLTVVVKFVALRLQSDPMDVERQHTHAHMVHGSSLCTRDAQVLSALTNVDDSCVLKRAFISSNDITIDPRILFV